MTENKQTVCTLLKAALRATSQYSDLIALKYEKDHYWETVTAVFENGATKTINVSMDSGSALIRDVVKGL